MSYGSTPSIVSVQMGAAGEASGRPRHDGAPAGIAGKALIFAWLVEAIAVAMGLILAVFAGVEGGDSGLAGMVIAILPFVALSIVELTKIPLVALAFRVRSGVWQFIAVAALLVVTMATFENFMFGFERGFNERIRAVANAEQAKNNQLNKLNLAKERIPTYTTQIAELQTQLSMIQKDMDGIRQQATGDIADAKASDDINDYRQRRDKLGADLAALDQHRDAAVAAERLRCQSKGVTCRVSIVAAGFQRQHQTIERQLTELEANREQQRTKSDALMDSARASRNVQLKAKEDERARAETKLAALRTQLSDKQQIVLQGSEEAARIEQLLDERMEHSQLHRLSDVIFGNHDSGNLDRTKKFFVVSLAAIVALIGSVIAAMYYASQLPPNIARHRLINSMRGYVARRRRRVPPIRQLQEDLRQRQRFWRSLRAWVARRRKRVVRIVPVPQDRLKLIYLPLTASEAQVNTIRADAQMDRSQLPGSRTQI